MNPFCPNCGAEDTTEQGHNWWLCDDCLCRWDEDQRTDEIPWRCYHCGEVCRTYEEADKHFGMSERDKPSCLTRALAAEQERDSLRADAEKFRALKAKVGHLYDFDAMGSTAPFTGTPTDARGRHGE